MTTQSTTYPEPNAQPARKTSTEGHSAMDSIEAAVPDLKSRVRQMVESGQTRVSEWKGGLEDGIREKPIQSILIAAGVGAVIGLLVGRRTR